MQTVFFSKVNVSLRFWEAPEPRWAEPADVQDVNACMHVDTGTDLHHDLSQRATSILGTGSSLRQGSRQYLSKNPPKKSVCSQTIRVKGVLVK